MKRNLGIIFIIIGISIIGYALWAKYSGEIKQRKMLEGFQITLNKMGETDGNLGNLEKENITEGIEGIKDKALDTNKQEAEPEDVIAILEIPKIELTAAVVEGTEMENLKYAIGHFNGTAMPGEKGNFCIAGHRSYIYNEYFNRADELDTGDVIIVKTKKGEFKYEVYEKRLVEPKEVSVLNPTEGSTITLVTCHPIRVATHRLIIKGRLKP